MNQDSGNKWQLTSIQARQTRCVEESILRATSELHINIIQQLLLSILKRLKLELLNSWMMTFLHYQMTEFECLSYSPLYHQIGNHPW